MNSSPPRAVWTSPTPGEGQAQRAAAALQGASLAFKNQQTAKPTQPSRSPPRGPHSGSTVDGNGNGNGNGALLAAASAAASSPRGRDLGSSQTSPQTQRHHGTGPVGGTPDVATGRPFEHAALAHSLLQARQTRQPSPHLQPPGAKPGTDPRTASFIAATLAASRSASPSVSPHQTGHNTGNPTTPAAALPQRVRPRAHSAASASSSAASLCSMRALEDPERERERTKEPESDTRRASVPNRNVLERRSIAPAEPLIASFEHGLEHIDTDPIKSPSPDRGIHSKSRSNPLGLGSDEEWPLKSSLAAQIPRPKPESKPKSRAGPRPGQKPRPKLGPKPASNSAPQPPPFPSPHGVQSKSLAGDDDGRNPRQRPEPSRSGPTLPELQTGLTLDGIGRFQRDSPGSTSTDETFFSTSSGYTRRPPSPPPARRTTTTARQLRTPASPRLVHSPRLAISGPAADGPTPPAPPSPRVRESVRPVTGRAAKPPGPARLGSSSNPSLALDSLTNAIVAGSLASAQHSRSELHLPSGSPGNHDGGSRSRSRSPTKRTVGMRQTLRAPQSKSDDEEARRHRERQRKRGSLGKKHAHHEGSRRRWREQVSAAERRRYEALWASNRGLLVELDQGWPGLEDHKSRTRGARGAKGPRNDQEEVVNVVVRDIWSRSRLPFDELGEVWQLVDRAGCGRLTKEEFVVGTWLVDQRLRGRKIPTRVSQSVWDSVKGLRVPAPGSSK